MPIDYCNANMTKWYSLSFYIHVSLMQNKIMNVNKWLLGSTKEKKSWPRKWLQWLLPDSHHWYLPCSSVGSYRFYRIVIFVSVNHSLDVHWTVHQTFAIPDTTGAHRIPPRPRDWSTIVPTSCFICISLLYRNISSRSTNRTSWLIASTASAAESSWSGKGHWLALSGKGRFSLSVHNSATLC